MKRWRITIEWRGVEDTRTVTASSREAALQQARDINDREYSGLARIVSVEEV